MILEDEEPSSIHSSKDLEDLAKEHSKPGQNYAERKDALTVVGTFGLQTLREKATFTALGNNDEIIIKQLGEIQGRQTSLRLYYDLKSFKRVALNHSIEAIGRFIMKKMNIAENEVKFKVNLICKILLLKVI